ncbi:MAG: histidine triad nucleotide-binding protein [Ktedonobacteraceae bacterium]
MDENCIFCKITVGQIPATIVYQDEDVVAIRDLHPQAKQHILIIPRQHIVSMAELTKEHGPLLASIYLAAQNIARQLGIEQSGYRVVTNVGPDSGQTIFHLHFHLLGGEQLGLFGKPILTS